MGDKDFGSRFKKRVNDLRENLRNSILAYQDSYHKGVEKFGVWWKIFHYSMWGFVVIFFVTAALILIFYVPRMEMLL